MTEICTGCFPDAIDWAHVTAPVTIDHALDMPEFLRRDIGEWPPFDQSACKLIARAETVKTSLTERDREVIAELTRTEQIVRANKTYERLHKAGFVVLAFLMFTRLDGHAVWVNSAQVNTVQGAGQLGMHQGTLINVGGDKFVVKQNVNQVVRALKRTP